MDISLVIPLFNEAESLPELTAWIEQVMKAHNYSYEILFINDGSTDGSWQVIESLQKKNPQIKGVKFRRNYGKSPALYTGFQRVQGRCSDHDGCRSSGQSGRNTGTLPHDNRRGIRSCFRMEKEKI